jgi:hypothetical protein
MIEVVDEPNPPIRALIGYTQPWNAPEVDLIHPTHLDPVGLRRTDIYSYGLIVWRIVLNGHLPYECLFWNNDLANAIMSKVTIGKSETEKLKHVSCSEFQKLKQEDDTVLHLAIDSLRNRQSGDIEFKVICAIFKQSLRQNPSQRSENFDEILKILSRGKSESLNE